MLEFDEDLWLSRNSARERRLSEVAERYLSALDLDEPLRSRVRNRVLAGKRDARLESPAAYAFAFGESLTLQPATCADRALTCHLYWAAADVADDVDDGEIFGERPLANDACALLFLAERRLQDGPEAYRRFGVDYGLKMACGQAKDLASLGSRHPYDPLEMAAGKAGAEFELFFALMSGDAVTYAPLGKAYGVAIQVFSDVADIYLKPMPDDFIAGACTLPLHLYRGGRATPWDAVDRQRPDVHAHLRYEAREASSEALEIVAAGLQKAWDAVAAEMPDPEPFGQAVTWLLASCNAVREGLAEIERPPDPPITTLHQGLVRAQAALEEQIFVEEHRWGLFDKPYVKADLFTTVFQAAALQALGAPWSAQFEKVLALRDPDGWRYYPHENDIPPDADDLGLILGYLGDALPEEVLEASVAQLVGGWSDSGIHTWLSASARIDWEGDDCPATLANAVWGLVRVGSGALVPEHAWHRLLIEAEGGAYESPFYTSKPTRYFLHRALTAGVAAAFLKPAAVGRARSTLMGEVAGAARLDGSFGDAVDTACTMLAAGEAKLSFDTTQSARWLLDRQRPDGLWPEVPVFGSPGVNYRSHVWGHPALTACFVVLALAEG